MGTVSGNSSRLGQASVAELAGNLKDALKPANSFVGTEGQLQEHSIA